MIETTKLITPPSIEPVTLAEVKAHLRIESAFTSDDSYISKLITTAREDAEVELRRAIITQTWDIGFSSWHHPRTSHANQGKHHHEIQLPFPSLQSITSVSYYDVNGTLQVLDPSLYFVVTGDPGRIYPASFAHWPLTQPMRPVPIIIRQVCGYGDHETDVPGKVQTAIMMMVALMYENRGESAFEMPTGIKQLLWKEDWGCYR